MSDRLRGCDPMRVEEATTFDLAAKFDEYKNAPNLGAETAIACDIAAYAKWAEDELREQRFATRAMNEQLVAAIKERDELRESANVLAKQHTDAVYREKAVLKERDELRERNSEMGAEESAQIEALRLEKEDITKELTEERDRSGDYQVKLSVLDHDTKAEIHKLREAYNAIMLERDCSKVSCAILRRDWNEEGVLLRGKLYDLEKERDKLLSEVAELEERVEEDAETNVCLSLDFDEVADQRDEFRVALRRIFCESRVVLVHGENEAEVGVDE